MQVVTAFVKKLFVDLPVRLEKQIEVSLYKQFLNYERNNCRRIKAKN